MIDSTFFQSKTFSKLSCLGFQKIKNLLYSITFKNSDLLCLSKKDKVFVRPCLFKSCHESKLSQVFKICSQMRPEQIKKFKKGGSDGGALEQQKHFRSCQGGDGLGLFKGCQVSCKYYLKAKTSPQSFFS